LPALSNATMSIWKGWLAGATPDVRARLLELRGVGRWTAEYVLLRGYGRLHVLRGDDVGAQTRLARWLAARRRSTTRALSL
jgi:3-methyladenine DNA glycosylase/8-oxoguanine DNA glycosylase